MGGMGTFILYLTTLFLFHVVCLFFFVLQLLRKCVDTKNGEVFAMKIIVTWGKEHIESGGWSESIVEVMQPLSMIKIQGCPPNSSNLQKIRP